MHVFGEPVGRQIVADAGLLGLAIDHRAGGGELVAEPDIVEEAGDLVVRLAALRRGRRSAPAGSAACRSRARRPSTSRARWPSLAARDPWWRRGSGLLSWAWRTMRSARLIALTSISGSLIELRCMPGSIQRSKKMLSRLLLAHITMSAPCDRVLRLRDRDRPRRRAASLICLANASRFSLGG